MKFMSSSIQDATLLRVPEVWCLDGMIFGGPNTSSPGVWKFRGCVVQECLPVWRFIRFLFW